MSAGARLVTVDAPGSGFVMLGLGFLGWAVHRHTDGTLEARKAAPIVCPECEQDRAREAS